MTKNIILKEKPLISAEEIAEKVKALGEMITRDYTDGKPILCVGVIRGAVIFFADLVREIKHNNVYLDFVTVSSYENDIKSKQVSLLHDIRLSAEGEHLLIIEDIADSGKTIKFLKNHFLANGAIDVKVACFVDKPSAREVDVSVDYTAFTLSGNPFIVGYGLDLCQCYRNLKEVYEVDLEKSKWKE